MNNIAAWVGAIATVTIVGGYPQKAKAEAFTGIEFLEWSEGEQRSYLSAQLVMASSIVSRSKPDLAQCLADAYYSDAGLTDQGYSEIRAKVVEFSEYHPSSVLVIMIENRCGALN